MKRAVVLTNHLHAWAGSEILALEVSEVLSETYEVSLVANVIANEIYTLFENHRINVSNEPHKFDLREFDFVWSQHFVAPLCRGFSDLENFSGSFNSIHLSPYEPFELASLVFSKPLGANLVSNSQETAQQIRSFYANSPKIHNLNNATKDDFAEKEILETQTFKPIESVLIVSNHIPEEVIRAAENLMQLGVTVAAFGLGQENYSRLSKHDIQKFDVVLTIGKTVQNAILARRPVYCYDRFGGPGYIQRENFKTSLDFNFSGRCCGRKLDAKQLCDEIVSGYDDALKGVNDLFNLGSELFDLKRFLMNLSEQKSKLSVKELDTQPIIQQAELIRNLYINSLRL